MDLSNIGFVVVLNMLGVMTPGPDLFLVLRLASRSRKHAFAAVGGIVTAVVFWATLSVTGASAILNKKPWILDYLQLFGGLWLAYMSFSLLRQVREYYRTRVGANNDVPVSQELGTVGAAYRLGMATNLSNPKAILYFTAILAPFLPVGAPWWVSVLYIVAILVSAGLVFSVVAFFVSTDAVRSRLMSVAHLIDLAAGLFFGVFAAVLIYNGITGLLS